MTRAPLDTEAELVAAQDYVRTHLLDGPDIEPDEDRWWDADDDRTIYHYPYGFREQDQ